MFDVYFVVVIFILLIVTMNITGNVIEIVHRNYNLNLVTKSE